jgi:hypothetical protein
MRILVLTLMMSLLSHSVFGVEQAEAGGAEVEEVANLVVALTTSGMDEGDTPIFLAASLGHVGIVKYLSKLESVRPEAAPTRGMYEGITPIFIAAIRGHVNVVKYLSELESVHPEAPLATGSKEGSTPIYIAAQHGHVDVVKFLSELDSVHPEDPLTSGTSEGFTPIYIAAQNDHISVVEYLSELEIVHPEVALTSGTSEGFTPIYIAAATGNVDVVKYFAKKDCTLRVTLPSGVTYNAISIARTSHNRLANWLQRISDNLVITYSVLDLMVDGRETREVEKFIHRQTPSLEDCSKLISIATRGQNIEDLTLARDGKLIRMLNRVCHQLTRPELPDPCCYLISSKDMERLACLKFWKNNQHLPSCIFLRIASYIGYSE